jgi:muramoyltetrapeptide carboxypeptidase LdcA involved in peptidoglycan recycling
MDTAPIMSLSAEDKKFYNSIKERLNALKRIPADESVKNILNYSKTLDNF